MTMPFSAIYHATPVEQAHALFLVDELFESSFVIAGRTAVLVLTTSGVDRQLLRDIWNVADPEGCGKLTSEQQFHVILRLVALAQAQQISVGSNLTQVLLLTQTYTLPLAHFGRVPYVPPPHELLQRYASRISTMMAQSNGTATTAMATLSVSDAFDDLVPVVDAPLPSLEVPPPPPPPPPTVEIEDGDDDFDEFVEAPDGGDAGGGKESNVVSPSILPEHTNGHHHGGFSGTDDWNHTAITPVADSPLYVNGISSNHETKSAPGIQDPGVEQNDSDPLSSAFDSIAPIQDNPLPVLGVGFRDTQDDDDDVEEHEDSFGDFDTPSALEHATINSADPMSSAFDAIAPIQDNPLPVLGNGFQGLDDDNDEGFGDFEDSPSTNATLALNGTDPLSSAFDAIAPIQDNPLPMLGSSGSRDENEDEGFGDFEDSPSTDATLALNGTDPLSSAFDAIAPIQDNPLPVLGSGFQDMNDKSDDFGDFEDSPPAFEDATHVPNGSVPLSSAFDEIAPIEDNPLPLMDSGSRGVNDDHRTSAFDTIAPVHDNLLPYLSSRTASYDDNGDDDDDNFGSFEDSSPATQAALALDDPLTSAFDEIAPIQDNPLPPLGSPSRGLNDDDNHDSFGDFEDSSPASHDTTLAQNGTDPLTSAFDEISPVHDNALPPLGSGLRDANNDDDDDPFASAFAAIAPIQDYPLPSLGSDSHDANDDDDDPLSSALAAIAPVQDIPLPSLGSGSRDTNDDDNGVDFGQFEDAPTDDAAVYGFSSSAKEEKVDLVLPGTGPLLSDEEAHHPLAVNDETPNVKSMRESSATEMSSFGLIPQMSQTSVVDTNDDPFAAFDAMVGPSVDLPPLPLFGMLSSEAVPEGGFVEASILDGDGANMSLAEEDFGDFAAVTVEDSADHVQGGMVGDKQADVVTNDDDDDEFGDFEGMEVFGNDSEEPKRNLPPENNVGFDTLIEHAKGGDNFGTFGNSEPPSNSFMAPFGTNDQSSGISGQIDDDDFGDFATVEVPFPATAGETDAHEGNWDSFQDAKDVSVNGNSDKSQPVQGNQASMAPPMTGQLSSDSKFGSFGGNITAPAVNHNGENFGDWNAFQNAEAGKLASSPNSVESLEEMRAKIRSIEMQLPDSIRRKSNKGGFIDFSKSFENNIMGQAPQGSWRRPFNNNSPKKPTGNDGSQRQERGTRCFQLVSLLASTHAKHASSNWEKIISVARDELAAGSFILQDGNSLSADTRREIRDTMHILVAGLGEYVRVVRAIVATFGDLLGLELSTEFTKDTLVSSWSSLGMLTTALHVEELWVEIQSNSRDFLAQPIQLNSVPEVRSNCLRLDPSAELCQLTLQRLSVTDRDTTRAPVQWGGKAFMACAANFWSNRVSVSVP